MKKIIILIITVAIALCFSSCIKIEYENPDAETTSTNEELNTTEMPSISVEELQSIVEITVPASMFDESNPPSDELSEEQTEEGFKSARINKDGSVTYTMTKNCLLINMIKTRQYAEDGIKNLVNEYDFIKKADYDIDYSTIRLYADEENYNNEAFYNAAKETAHYVNMYQIYTDEKIGCTLEIYSNKKTTDLIDSVTYPQ